MKIRHWLRKHSLAIECFLVFATCVYVYLANDRTITTHDPIPNTLLAFNWIFNHQLNFDNFRGNYFFNAAVWFFTESPTGHLTSAYPIGTAIVTFPFYLIFSGVMWFNHTFQDPALRSSLYSLDIHRAFFETDRLFYEKLAATLTTSTAVVIFYLATSLKFKKSICLILTFLYAFATQNWVTNSQSLLQHTAANLVICSLLLCLLKANRRQGRSRNFLLLVAGILAGLLPGIRPTDAVFTVAAIVYVIFVYRRDCVYLCLGLCSSLISISWNFYYFGTLLLGGYASQTDLYSFSLNQFVRSFLGLLFSPSRGLFFFSPVLLLMIPGAFQVFRLRSKRDEQLLICLCGAGVALFVNYCFFSVWWGAWGYGYRFLAEALPIFCFLIGYPLVNLAESNKKKRLNYKLCCFVTLLIISTSVQAVGAFTLEFGKATWDLIPAEISTKAAVGMGRLWSFSDSPIERSARLLFHEVTGLPKLSQTYLDGLKGEIKQAQILDTPIKDGMNLGTPGSFALLQVDLLNTGRSEWYGYDSGVKNGSIAVKAQFYDQNNESVTFSRFYIPGMTRPGQRTRATTFIELPANFGTYRLVLSLTTSQELLNQKENQYELKVKIDPKQQIFDQSFKKVQVSREIPAGTEAKLFTLVESRSNFVWASKVRDAKNNIKNPVKLAYYWIDTNGRTLEDGTAPLPWKVVYEQDFFFNIAHTIGINTTIKVPDRPGNYTLRLTMAQDGVGRFDENGAKPKDIPITVTAS
ncbi:MAG: hypothetical protein KME18_15970 [Phormidium tanganyikae FI6-MK23]|jgi:hypothetical protein|nr:hypothetical protein [Phormidium tanganyikae FI6-MK23]